MIALLSLTLQVYSIQIVGLCILSIKAILLDGKEASTRMILLLLSFSRSCSPVFFSNFILRPKNLMYLFLNLFSNLTYYGITFSISFYKNCLGTSLVLMARLHIRIGIFEIFQTL